MGKKKGLWNLLSGAADASSAKLGEGVSIDEFSRQTGDTVLTALSGVGEAKSGRKIVDNVVLFMGAAGGTGTSTVVANVATSATKMGYSVVVIDLNILYPSQYRQFNIREPKKQGDLYTFLSGETEFPDSVEMADNVSILYAKGREVLQNAVMDDEKYASNFSSALDTLRVLYDLVLIDCPLKIEHDVVCEAVVRCSAIYSVWDEGVGCIANIDRIRKNIEGLGGDAYVKMRVVLNKRTDIRYSDEPFKRLNMEYVSILPWDKEIIEQSLRGGVFNLYGVSKDENSKEFVHGIDELTQYVIAQGGGGQWM